MQTTTAKPRSYNSPRRREQAAATRLAILQAARELFERDGYAATKVSAVAKRAGVAEKTVYLAFETKPGLLRGVWNRALRGDDDEIPVAQKEWFLEVLSADDPRQVLELNARNARRLKSHIGPLGGVFRAAAAAEPEIRAFWDERVQRDFRDNQRMVVQRLAKLAALREGLAIDRAADMLWTLNHPDNWMHLVEDRGWTPEEYERWLAEASAAQLLEPRTL
jgi:AcrR family transcriptional regulator